MVKKIGSAFFVLSMFFFMQTFAVQGTITLEARTINGEPLHESALVGVPFLLEVSVHNEDSVPGMPTITGLQQLSVEDKGHTGTINSIINGVRSTKKIFQYRVRAERCGTYTIGPALLTNRKQRLQSNTVVLEVVQEQTVRKKTEPFLQAVVDKQAPVVGEPVEFSLRFYPLGAARLEGISEPKFSNFSASKLDGPFSGRESIDEQTYDYIEWKTMLYPQKAGTQRIASIAACYKKQNMRRHTGFDMFDQFFGGSEQKQIFSNSVYLEVDALPPYEGRVDGVGNLTNFTASIDHQNAQEGEGMVYSLALEGYGDLDSIEPIELVVPEGLRYYESKSSLAESGKKKTFEYIIQGTKPGDWQIPQQHFTYFDLASKTYKRLKSNSVDVVIAKGALQGVGDTEKPKTEDVAVIANMTPDGLAPLITQATWKARKEQWIPYWLLIFLMVIPAFLAMLSLASRAWATYQEDNRVVFNKKNAFKYARQALDKAQATDNVAALHELVVQLFVHRASGTYSMSAEAIERYMQDRGFEHDRMCEWRQFFNELLQARFFKQGTGDIFGQGLFQKTELWLQLLEDRLKRE